ncbi:site-specific integrase [Deefgea piscis]|uniref:Site-specific integrase n=1 Tax=Deefgea piscis TaxID=2739061 RepID=A0A6M8SRR4_9NEIS|nr:site-specific integrase [Deefgea piscis]QKJ66824.1 site-specific integrase [Deefgea piscis]
MASLEYIHYKSHRAVICERSIHWDFDTSVQSVERLPQVFWLTGEPWSELNLWALEMGRNRDVNLKTIHSLLEHLHKYANWLEQEQLDWRHFPQTKAHRVLVRFRGFLVEARDRRELSPSTTTARMNAVIRFYRYAASRNFISRDAPMWRDKSVVLPYFDAVGFERTMTRITTDISIPNRRRPGIRLEGGLLPLSEDHMVEMLQFAKESASEELYLMLLIGCFSGARLGTITTLRVSALNEAIRDSQVSGMWIIPVGPGTGIASKFDVSGDLMIPDQLMTILKAYMTSRRHLERVIRANNANKSYLFLSRFNRPYKVAAVDREMVHFRRVGQIAGLRFLQNFKFHQTRATYGTWLMSICLSATSVKASIEFVKRAMHHKNESTTFGYITFIKNTQIKIEVANNFAEAFLGLQTRLKGDANA